jgi:type I restriction enzyme S subunit
MFEYCSLSKILNEKGYIRGPFGSKLVRHELQDHGVPVYEQQHAITGSRSFRFFIAQEKFVELSRFQVKTNDLIISCSGTVGKISIIKEGDPLGIISQALLILRPDPEIMIPEFLYYYLNTHEGQQRLITASHGSVQVNIAPRSTVERIRIPLPPLPIQRRIAHILGTLDDKIEQARRMNATLEAIARALFRSWFVDFDPVRAKADGRDPPGMDTTTAALFPAAFEDSPLGKVPRGWRVGTVGDTMELAYGRGLKEDKRCPGNIPVYGSNGIVGWHDEKLVDGPGIIVGRKGNPGTVKWSAKDFFPIDTTFYVIPQDRNQSMYYLYHALCWQNLTSLAADSAVPGLNRNLAYMNEILIPPSQLLEVFDKQASALDARYQLNETHTRTLAALRDTLLPKLLSGEVGVGGESA